MPTTDDQRDPAVAAAPVTDPDATDPDATVPDSDPQPAGRRKRSWRQLMMVVVAAIVLMLLIKAFVVQVYRIPSSSMEDTLLTGDRVLVNKLVYHVRGIARGDIVVFKRPPGETDPKIKDLIKRVVALPGETVSCQNQKIVIGGQILDEPAVAFAGLSELGFDAFAFFFELLARLLVLIRGEETVLQIGIECRDVTPVGDLHSGPARGRFGKRRGRSRPSHRACRSRAGRACRWKSPIRRAGPTADRGASRFRVHPS